MSYTPASFTTKRNNIDLYDASHMNAVQEELVRLGNYVANLKAGGASLTVGFTQDCDYVCDGANDEVQIQQAIDDLVALETGGTILIKNGSYNIAQTITVGNQNVAGIHIVGEGVNSTVINLTPTFTGNEAIALNTPFSSISQLSVQDDGSFPSDDLNGIAIDTASAGITFIVIDTVHVGGMRRSATRGHGIRSDGLFVLIKDSLCIANEGDGFRTTQYTMISDCLSFQNQGLGFYLAGDSLATNCQAFSCNSGFELAGGGTSVSNCTVQACTGIGMTISGDGCVVTNCAISLNGDDGIFITSASLGTSINNCTITANESEGIFCQGNSIKITSCTVAGNSADGIEINTGDNNIVCNNVVDSYFDGVELDTDNVYSGILLTGTTLRNIVNGNRVLKGGGTNDFQYGIREASSSDDRNLITSNIVTNAQTGNISTQGANSVSANNITA